MLGKVIAAGAALAVPLLLMTGSGSGAAVALAASTPKLTTATPDVQEAVVVDGSNGQLDPATLCRSTVSIAGTMGLLQCPAAADLDRLAAAFEAALGDPLCFGNGYRTYGQQVRIKAAKPHLAAQAGTSNHGWGLAVDLCGGIERFGTREHQWMRAHAPSFGWVHPAWAQRNGTRPEAWHWEWQGE